MKKVFVFIALIAATTYAKAQSNKEDIDIIQSVLGKQKKEIVADFLKLQGASADAFWVVYDQYETERKTLGKQRIALLEKYAANYDNPDPAQLDQMMKETQALQAKTDKLIISYYGKVKKAAGVKTAAQFYQIESYFLVVIRASILDSIPLIGELNDKW